MSKTVQTPDAEDLLNAGTEALASGAWDEAREFFETALRDKETSQALEGLGMAAWWLDDAATTFTARERAYQLYRQHGDFRGAGGHLSGL
jgi:hypothetical protein